ncbi:hypothetical protein DID88_009562 [Monilinia fructigena]|uniref:xanthine dehydrogenase n=1 Tax=Monilinia fructigena TaxID=38457 RepID=A0A395IQ49_9HELO|nr:hypothetical protein DID88_009562 [Monilinia fructigena]
MAPIAVSPDHSPEPAVPLASSQSLSSVTTTYDDTLRFYLNGTRVVIDNMDPEITLLDYLRGIGLTGTKLGCAEGGCGACTVVVSQYNPTTKKIYHASVNACLAPLVSVDGKHVITVEGIGNTKRPHPTQERIAKGNGSQCGFCTPGIVMSLYALLRNDSNPSEHDVEEAFDGNLCRCTGYRPILDAAQTFSSGAGCGKSKANGGGGCCMEKSEGSGGCCKNELEDDQPIKRFTPPGFIEYNPDTELIFPPPLRRHEFKPLAFGNKKKKWYRPVTIEQLLEIKSVYPSAKIIGGSTETQIEIKFKAMQYTTSVFVGDIPELRQFSFKDDHLEIGGNVILTDLEWIVQQAEKHYGPENGQVFKAIHKQLKYFAGRQIRNVGTPAGNLATASPISDLNPVFVASNATLIARSLDKVTEIPMSEFFKGYRLTALAPDAIIASIRIPVTQKGEYLRAYKQSKRKDDDIAIVNAALRVAIDDSQVVTSTSLVYGGMAPTTIAARKAGAYLLGKKFTDPVTLEGTMNALEEDFNLSFSVPGGMATYRKSLAFGFFYRFYHEILSKLEVKDLEVDAQVIPEIERIISFGKEDRESTVAYQQNVLGKASPHVAALKQTCGEAQYTDDIPVQKNDVNYAPALDLPGVVQYVDHTDMPSPEANFWGAPVCDETFFAVDEVFTTGQPIGIVLADSATHATAGARAVKVEYEDLPAIFTMEEAIEKESFFDHYRYIKKGEPEKAFEQADHVFSGVSRIGGQEHFYLETQACVAIPKIEDGEMEIWSGTQNPTETQTYVAQVCDVAANKVVSKVKRLGGGFGGKETRSIQLCGIVSLAAKKTGRPVRCMLNRDEDMITSGQRHPFLSRWKVAINKDAAEALGVPLSNVFISETATNTVANTSSTAASASSDLNGYAIFNACAQINERLAPYREKFGPGATMKELAHAAYFDRVNLSANGFYKTPDIGYTWGPNTGQMFFYFTQGVTASEVEIDTLTGAFVQGMGLFTTEESLWFRAGPMAGQLATRGPGAYKIPGFRDIPQEFNVSLLKGVEWEELKTIQRSRGVGEPPLFMGSAVFFAIRDALKAARKEYGVTAEIGEDIKGGGLLRLESPATPERIRISCADPILKRAEQVGAVEARRAHNPEVPRSKLGLAK